MSWTRLRLAATGFAIWVACPVWAATTVPGDAFHRALDREREAQHALNRLTFGFRPGDAEALEKEGLKRWLDRQLSPEKIAEDPDLARRLQPYESVRLTAREAFLRYPAPQLIRAVARGNARLPEDPDLRAVVEQLAQRYRKRTAAGADPAQTSADDDEADLTGRVPLEQLLSPDQVRALRSGSREEKTAVLAAIPSSRSVSFVFALRPSERRPLLPLAPVPLARELMLSMSPQNVVALDLTASKILRATYSNRQLYELLVDFWYNHFNVFIDKGPDHYLAPSYEREAIRPHIFGKFYALLLATAQSPAMLFYLDNWQSVAPGTGADRQRARGLNENYARELMELHTLGVDGGYTQHDVTEVARCFTGWTIARPREGGGFKFNPKVHDNGPKVVLGHRIAPGGGIQDGLTVLRLLADHPSTARFVSLQLARRFVADEPPASLVDRMASTFLHTHGDLRQVTRVMITAPEFWSEGAFQAKVKTPFEMVVSALRATHADVSSPLVLAQELQRLGEPLYRKIEPTGYSWANAEWTSSAGLLERMNFALALTHGKVPGLPVDRAPWQQAPDPVQLATTLLGHAPSPPTRSAVEQVATDSRAREQLAQGARINQPEMPSLIAGVTLGSPDFQRR